MNGVLVESPGTAPGSEPRITGAFIAIVTVARDRSNIGARLGRCKREGAFVSRAFCVLYLCIRFGDRKPVSFDGLFHLWF